jgi:hypothetical protein
MNIGHQTIMLMQCMNLLHLPEKYQISILDGGVYTCVIVQG